MSSTKTNDGPVRVSSLQPIITEFVEPKTSDVSRVIFPTTIQIDGLLEVNGFQFLSDELALALQDWKLTRGKELRQILLKSPLQARPLVGLVMEYAE
jgi:hypothetical protein